MSPIKAIQKTLKNKSSNYRAKPFWAWNGKLDPQELCRQIRVMKKMGLGGFFMHARVGLDTPYLGREWFECVDACVKEAKKLDMEAWLYDEDRWPSGAAGGFVTRNPEYRMKTVICQELTSLQKFKWEDNILAVFTANIDEKIASQVKKISKAAKLSLEPSQKLLVFRIVSPQPSSWYNGQVYLDTMNIKAVKKFIQITHDKYKKYFKEEFGKTIPGIFTDEPHHGSAFNHLPHTNHDHAIPWTKTIPKVFKQRYGYDIIDHLVELFYEVDNKTITPSRHDYHDCITYLFTNAFAKTIAKWCDEAGIKFTGHVLYEDLNSYQTHVVGSAMRTYEYMQVPGMDLLTEFSREFDTAKQVSSVARQFGRKWRLTETYGCTGWQFPLSGHKALGDWQAALGINLRCQHLAWYTMEGEAKRDYPASISYQSPWWDIYSKVEDYFSRIHTVMTRGQEVRDLLVLHPIESSWAIFNPGWKTDKTIQALDESMIKLRDSLLGRNIDFDYGDEDILSRHTQIIKQNGKTICKVGHAKYTTVLVPPMLTMRGTTLELLEKFHDAGGKVVFSGKIADYLDVKKSSRIKYFAEQCMKAPAEGPELVNAVVNCQQVSITDSKGREIPDVLYLLREDKNAWYLFVCNYGVDYTKIKKEVPVSKRINKFPDVRISGFRNAKSVVEIDCNDGQCYHAQITKLQKKIVIHTSLLQLGSRLFVILKNKQNVRLSQKPNLKTISRKTINKLAWDYSLSECNNLVLDRPKARIGKKNLKTNKDILQIDQSVRSHLKLKQRGEAMLQPWAQEKNVNCQSIPVELTYNFDVKKIPSGELYIAIERPDLYQIFINGTNVSTENDQGWWVDKSLRRIVFSPMLLKEGKNELKLLCNYDENHPGLEIIYLLGNFGTNIKGTNVSIVPLPAKLKLGDWTKQGLSFYSGSINYHMKVKAQPQKNQKILLRIPSYKGTAVRVWVNSEIAGIIAWQPNEVDITGLLTKTKNTISIEVFSHRGNSHGPLHLRGNSEWIGPSQFIAKGDEWDEGYRIFPCGLTDKPKLIVKEKYDD